MIGIGSKVRIRPLKNLIPELRGLEVEVAQILMYPETDTLGKPTGQSLAVYALVIYVDGREFVVNSDEVDEVATQ